MKRTLAILLVILLMLSDTPVSHATNVGSSLNVGIQSSKTTIINPLDPVERDVLSVYNLVYESLITIDDDYLPQPKLAESWEMSSGGKNWTFHLRTDVMFSDGTPMTSRDVVATAQFILDRANDESAQNKGYYENLRYFVSRISAPDNYTVTFRAARSYMGLLYAMTFPILPADLVNTENPPGTGPYRIKAFEPGSYIWLENNENWWQTWPQVRQIMFTCYNTQNAVIQAYDFAQVDTVFTRSTAAAQYKTGTTSVSVAYRTNQLETLLINHSSSPLNSKNVRYAIRYVVDPDLIASSIYMGMVDRTDTPVIPGTWMYNNDLSSYFVKDQAKAMELLAADGWADSNEDGVLDRLNKDGKLETLHLRIYVYEEPDNDVRVETAKLIASQLAAIGISSTVDTMTMSDMATKLKAGSFDLALASYAMDTCPDPGFLLMSGNTGNYTRYRSSEMTELCKELRTKTDQASYQSTLHKVQRLFAEDCPFICLFYRRGKVLSRQMYTTVRDMRELELMRGIEYFKQ